MDLGDSATMQSNDFCMLKLNWPNNCIVERFNYRRRVIITILFNLRHDHAQHASIFTISQLSAQMVKIVDHMNFKLSHYGTDVPKCIAVVHTHPVNNTVDNRR